MASEFHSLEESLKTFLMDAQNDNYNSGNANLYKYNNLKLYMEPKKNSTPHFIISVGISESMYNLENYEKISGGLGSDERYVRRWIAKYLKKGAMDEIWKKSTKSKSVTMKPDLNYDDDD